MVFCKEASLAAIGLPVQKADYFFCPLVRGEPLVRKGVLQFVKVELFFKNQEAGFPCLGDLSQAWQVACYKQKEEEVPVNPHVRKIKGALKVSEDT